MFLVVIIAIAVILAFSAFLTQPNTILARVQETESVEQKNEVLEIAKKYVTATPTFAFDGIFNTLKTEHVEMIETNPPQYLVVISFDSEHDGYGNRHDMQIKNTITHHKMEIVVSKKNIISAITDKTWDEVNQTYIQRSQSKLSFSNGAFEFKGEIIDLGTFIAALKSRGLDIQTDESVSNSFFSVPSTLISISGIDVYVYEFTSEYDIAKAKAIISKDGTTIGSNSVRWIDTPHFYNKEMIIVQYIGHNPEIMSVLESLLGEQFAGGT